MKKSTLSISGMGCSGCVTSVKEALNAIEGVESAEVKLEEESAEVSFDEGRVQYGDFKKAVEDAGYSVTGVKD